MAKSSKKQKKKAKSPVVTPAKRRRDSMMSNRNLRYVLSKDGKIHDRDCPCVTKIPDAEFEMCEDFLHSKVVCFQCHRRAIIRMGLELDLTKYLDAAVWFFQKVGATIEELNSLFVENNARSYHMEVGCIYVRVKEDNWCLEVSDNKTCWLYHNNYQLTADGQRFLESQFHLQVEKPIPFFNALVTMRSYTWIVHIPQVAEEGKLERQTEMLRRLEAIPGFRWIPQRSLLFRDFQIVVPKEYPEEMPFSVVKKGTYHECNMLLCRIPFWRKRKVSKMEDAVKTYCAQKEYLYYEKLCMHFFLEEPNAVEFM